MIAARNGLRHTVKEMAVDHEIVAGILRTAAVGVGATLVMDAWALLQKRAFGIASLDYRFVGRWIGYFPQGKFAHEAIGKAAPVSGEALLGWGAHYLIGVLFAFVLVALWGTRWLDDPTLAPALIVGIGSIAAPFFVMQPGLGIGIAASRTPKPWVTRFRSLVAHISFGVGLYVSGVCLAQISEPIF
jgi:hypothetical protein